MFLIIIEYLVIPIKSYFVYNIIQIFQIFCNVMVLFRNRYIAQNRLVAYKSDIIRFVFISNKRAKESLRQWTNHKDRSNNNVITIPNRYKNLYFSYLYSDFSFIFGFYIINKEMEQYASFGTIQMYTQIHTYTYTHVSF